MSLRSSFHLLLLFCLASSGSPSSPVANSNYSVVCAGQVNGNLLFISNYKWDYIVYQFPPSTLDSAANRIHTSDFQPVSVKSKWPVLSVALDQIEVATSVTVQDATNGDYIFVVRNSTDNDGPSVFVQLRENEQYFVDSLIQWNHHIWISSTEPYHFYVLQQQPNHSLAKYRFSADSNTPARETDLVHWTEIKQKTDFLSMCLEDGSIVLSMNPCQSSVDWDLVTSGMVIKERFYLLGPDTVYSFDKTAFTEPGTAVNLTTTSLDYFFGTPQKSTLSTETASNTKASHVVTIVVAITVTVVVLSLVILSIYILVIRRPKKKHLEHHHEQTHGPVPRSTKQNRIVLVASALVNNKAPPPPSSIASKKTKMNTGVGSQPKYMPTTRPYVYKKIAGTKNNSVKKSLLLKIISMKQMPTTRSASWSKRTLKTSTTTMSMKTHLGKGSSVSLVTTTNRPTSAK